MTLKEWNAYVVDDHNWKWMGTWAGTGWMLYSLRLPGGLTDKEPWMTVKYWDELLGNRRILRIGSHHYWQPSRPEATGLCAGGLARRLWELERGKSK